MVEWHPTRAQARGGLTACITKNRTRTFTRLCVGRRPGAAAPARIENCLPRSGVWCKIPAATLTSGSTFRLTFASVAPRRKKRATDKLPAQTLKATKPALAKNLPRKELAAKLQKAERPYSATC